MKRRQNIHDVDPYNNTNLHEHTKQGTNAVCTYHAQQRLHTLANAQHVYEFTRALSDPNNNTITYMHVAGNPRDIPHPWAH